MMWSVFNYLLKASFIASSYSTTGKKLTNHSSIPRGEVALFIASFVPVPAACKYLNIFSGDALVIGILIPSYGSESIPYRCESSHIYTRNNKKDIR